MTDKPILLTGVFRDEDGDKYRWQEQRRSMNQNSIMSLMNIILFVWAMLSQQKVTIAFHKKYPCPPTAQQTELDALDPSCTTLYRIHTITTETSMMTSSNGHIFRVTGHLCGEQRPVTRSFGLFFDLRLNKRLNKQSWGWWFETLSHPLWSHRNEEYNTKYNTD